MAVTWKASGTAVASTTTTISPSHPSGVTAGDLLVLIVSQKPATANGGGVTTPAGWTLQVSNLAAGGWGSTLGADTGNTNLWMFTKVAVGNETGALAVTIADSNVTGAQISNYASATKGYSYSSATGSQTVTPTASLSVTLSSMTVADGDMVVWAFGNPTDAANYDVSTVTVPGATFGAAVEIIEAESTAGNDFGGVYGYTPVVTGGTGVGTFTSTLSGTLTNVRGPVVALVLHQMDTGPSVNKMADTDFLVATNSGIIPGQQVTDTDFLVATNSGITPGQQVTDTDFLVATNSGIIPGQQVTDVDFLVAIGLLPPDTNLDAFHTQVVSVDPNTNLDAFHTQVVSVDPNTNLDAFLVTVVAATEQVTPPIVADFFDVDALMVAGVPTQAARVLDVDALVVAAVPVQVARVMDMDVIVIVGPRRLGHTVSVWTGSVELRAYMTVWDGVKETATIVETV